MLLKKLKLKGLDKMQLNIIIIASTEKRPDSDRYKNRLFFICEFEVAFAELGTSLILNA